MTMPINTEARHRIVEFCRTQRRMCDISRHLNLSVGGTHSHVTKLASEENPWIEITKMKINRHWHVMVRTIRPEPYYMKYEAKKMRVERGNEFLNRMMGIYTGKQPVRGIVHRMEGA